MFTIVNLSALKFHSLYSGLGNNILHAYSLRLKIITSNSLIVLEIQFPNREHQFVVSL